MRAISIVLGGLLVVASAANADVRLAVRGGRKIIYNVGGVTVALVDCGLAGAQRPIPLHVFVEVSARDEFQREIKTRQPLAALVVADVEELDDVQNVYYNLKVSDEALAALEGA